MAKFKEQLAAVWAAWKRIARVIGNFQARVILTVIYAVILLPFAVFARLFTDPLHIKNRPAKWTESPSEAYDLEWARKQ